MIWKIYGGKLFQCFNIVIIIIMRVSRHDRPRTINVLDLALTVALSLVLICIFTDLKISQMLGRVFFHLLDQATFLSCVSKDPTGIRAKKNDIYYFLAAQAKT